MDCMSNGFNSFAFLISACFSVRRRSGDVTIAAGFILGFVGTLRSIDMLLALLSERFLSSPFDAENVRWRESIRAAQRSLGLDWA